MTARAEVTAIVLAGGRSARFGGPKIAAELDGATLLQLAVEAVAAIAAEVVVVLAPGAAEQDPDRGLLPPDVAIRFVHDPESFGGPLVGLGAGLRAASHPLAVVVGGDMPRLRPAVLEAMLEALRPDGPTAPDAVEAVVLSQAGISRPLPLALAVAPAGRAAAATLAAGERSLRDFLRRLHIRELAEAAWRMLDPEAGTLVDVDLPEDLERLRR